MNGFKSINLNKGQEYEIRLKALKMAQINNISEYESQYLYKYYAFNDYAEKIFTNNELYFPSPIEFNDPFDSKGIIEFKGTKQQQKEYLIDLHDRRFPGMDEVTKNEKINMIIQNGQLDNFEPSSHLDELGVFCMSEINDNILMWSHYSDKHSGFCLEFDSYSKFFGRSQKVNYQVDYPVINFFGSTDSEQVEIKLLTKAKFWAYEKEWRVIEHVEGPGIYRFQEELLKGVIFGCRMPLDKKERIYEWCKSRAFLPKLYEVKVKERQYGLDIINIDYT